MRSFHNSPPGDHPQSEGSLVLCADGLAAQSGEHCNCIRGFYVSLWKLKAGMFFS